MFFWQVLIVRASSPGQVEPADLPQMHDLPVQLVAPVPQDVGGVSKVREVVCVVDVLSPDEVPVADLVEDGSDHFEVDDVDVAVAPQRPQLLQFSLRLDLLKYQRVHV